MTIQETLAEGKRLLSAPHREAFIDTPSLDASLLLAELLNISREELILQGSQQLAESKRKKYFELLERRSSGECIAYILGRREFRGLTFAVNPNVLVPRPDTETLVEAALEYIDPRQERKTLGAKQDVFEGKVFPLLDLCTGSGAVAISLKNERPFLEVTASDISAPALETAALNAERLLDKCLPGVSNAVRFINSDLFKNIPGKFGIIVCNPPYIPSGELSSLAPELQKEPKLALDGGPDGLTLIRKIIFQAPEHLLPGGVLLLEAGVGQMPDICPILETHHFCDIRIHKDMAGRDRVISGKKVVM